jgi:hypothetical protein
MAAYANMAVMSANPTVDFDVVFMVAMMKKKVQSVKH